jgi:hypothetical protein
VCYQKCKEILIKLLCNVRKKPSQQVGAQRGDRAFDLMWRSGVDLDELIANLVHQKLIHKFDEFCAFERLRNTCGCT